MSPSFSPKAVYHALVPETVRYPIGRWRRGVADRWLRLRTPGRPLPPRPLLRSVQMTPWVREYLEVGRVSAAAVRDAFAVAGLASAVPGEAPRVLDFGCGLGRTLRFLEQAGWRLHGCDVDPRSLAWSRQALGFAEFQLNRPEPPLPYPDGRFDGLFAVSVFTHFAAAQQRTWAAEVARVLRPGGIACITTMGPHAYGAFPALATDANRRRLAETGFVFHPGSGGAGVEFNADGAFHGPDELARIFDGWMTVERRLEGGVDGFQDLTVLRRVDCVDTDGAHA